MRRERELTPEQSAALSDAARQVAAELGERWRYPAYSIKRIMRAHGEAFVRQHVERAKVAEASGGLLRNNGERRTLGGVFFKLVKDTLGMDGYRAAVPLTFKEFCKRERERRMQRIVRATAA